jgi:hypothetical protein
MQDRTDTDPGRRLPGGAEAEISATELRTSNPKCAGPTWLWSAR